MNTSGNYATSKIILIIFFITVVYLFFLAIPEKDTKISNNSIEIQDTERIPVISYINIQYNPYLSASANIQNEDEIEIDAFNSKNISLKLKIHSTKNGKIIIDNLGMKNPTPLPVPGKPIKFLEIGTQNITYSKATISIKYTHLELKDEDENSLMIFHWSGNSWNAIPTIIDKKNDILTANPQFLSPFAVSVFAKSETQFLKIIPNRMVILDDPSGWVRGMPASVPDSVSDQYSGESTTIRWSVFVMNSNGLAASGINVNTVLKSPNGTVFSTHSGITDINGIADFSENLNNLNQIRTPWNIEGNWTISAEAQEIKAEANFIYDEYGCGRSSTNSQGCHVSNWDRRADVEPQTINRRFGGGIQDSPYTHTWDKIHNGDRHRGKVTPEFRREECQTCHSSYNGIYLNRTGRDLSLPQFAGGVHSKVTCTTCHDTWLSERMPIKQCYDCHPLFNFNPSPLNYKQSSSESYSFNSIKAHNSKISCIVCHNNGHNITKPLIFGTSNTITEFEQCTTCHIAYKLHNNNVSCTVCHSQDIHIIKIFAQDGTYTSLNKGNCTTCHQNPNFFDILLSQPNSGNITGKKPPQIQTKINHSNDFRKGQKWNNYWIDEFSSCLYCHGNTLHKIEALGRPSTFSGNNIVNSTISEKTNWCASCHFQGYISGINSYNDTINSFSLVPPEITGHLQFGANPNIPEYFNHFGFSDISDITCKGCHGSPLMNTITEFMHNVSIGINGGPDCALCHDIDGISPKVVFSEFKQSVHKSLNNNAINKTILSDNANKACWACHGNGTEPEKHPERFKNPKKCSNNECHALFQLYDEPMVYSHFKDSELNNNPTKSLNYNISTKVRCEICHSNSVLLPHKSQIVSSSHYSSKKDFIDSVNCIYCHLNEENSKLWGNATEINKNRTDFIEIDRVNNKFTIKKDEIIELGLGYRLKLNDTSILRRSASLELYKGYDVVDFSVVSIPSSYVYEEVKIINNASSKIPVIVLNITDLFSGENTSFIQFEGLRTKRLHSETKPTSCYKCHFIGDKRNRFIFIERKDNFIYYTEVLFNSFDQNNYNITNALSILENKTSSDSHVSFDVETKKSLIKGEVWKLSDNYILTLDDVSTDSNSARLSLEIGDVKFVNVVRKGELFEYESKLNYKSENMTFFRAVVSEISQPNIVILENIVALSQDVKRIDENSTIFGYNASWLRENVTYESGLIPQNFHVPMLYDGRDGGADCNTCHNIELGVHVGINKGNISSSKSCWACHGDGSKPRRHPFTYKTPKQCKVCHVENEGFFDAPYIGDEEHGKIEDCNLCHVTNIHKIMKFDLSPGIRQLTLNRISEYELILNATAAAGYLMKLRNAEYYIDSFDTNFSLLPVDGVFDEQFEELSAIINTSRLSSGTHVIYVRAMERNQWGPSSSISFVVGEKATSSIIEDFERIKESLPYNAAIYGFVFVLLVIIIAYLWMKKKL